METEQFSLTHRYQRFEEPTASIFGVGEQIPDGDGTSSKLSVNIYRTVRRHIPEGIMAFDPLQSPLR